MDIRQIAGHFLLARSQNVWNNSDYRKNIRICSSGTTNTPKKSRKWSDASFPMAQLRPKNQSIHVRRRSLPEFKYVPIQNSSKSSIQSRSAKVIEWWHIYTYIYIYISDQLSYSHVFQHFSGPEVWSVGCGPAASRLGQKWWTGWNHISTRDHGLGIFDSSRMGSYCQAYAHTHTHIYIHMHLYIYIYIYTYTHTQIYIYMHNSTIFGINLPIWCIYDTSPARLSVIFGSALKYCVNKMPQSMAEWVGGPMLRLGYPVSS